jgi:hypothetical protein
MNVKMNEMKESSSVLIALLLAAPVFAPWILLALAQQPM